MIYKSHYLPQKEYASKEELFSDLKSNLEQIIDFKKKVQKSCEKGASVTCRPLDTSKFNEGEVKALKLDENYYYIAVNTTNILDSHDDVHLPGIWKKTINEKQFKNYLVTDHELEVLNTVVRKEYVEIFTMKIPFSALGKPYSGKTEALIYKFPKDKVMIPMVKEWLDSGDALEGSVRMKYINFLFCLDSNAPEDAEFKKNYDNYIEAIANKDDFEYIPYFFAIKEASNEQESSLVLRGSNEVTGQLETTRTQEEKTEKVEETEEIEKEEPSADTPEDKNEEPTEEVTQKTRKFNVFIKTD